jgi:hypothetical protein
MVAAQNDGGREAAVRDRRVKGQSQLAAAFAVGVQYTCLAPYHQLVCACLFDPPKRVAVLISARW